MGQWGGGLFESDHVADLVCGDMPTDLKLSEPIHDESQRRHLNNGHFTRV
jgi:hypothetical protein